MKTAHLTWEEVKERAEGQAVEIMYDGIESRGNCEEIHMIRKFGGCEFVQLTRSCYQVTKWPERRRT